MANAQGIKKQTVVNLQLGLRGGVTGSGQVLRRSKSVFESPKATYAVDESAQHGQSTGIVYGVNQPKGKIDGVLSPSTYKQFLQSLLRKNFAATPPLSLATLTIGGVAGAWTITETTGLNFLTSGFKVGDVVRLTGSNLNTANVGVNLLITDIASGTVLTCAVVNGAVLITEAAKSSSTVTVVGKKTLAPMTNQTNDYYTFEEWYSDVAQSEVFADMKVTTAAVTVSSNGPVTVAFDFQGATAVSTATSQVLTNPITETTTPVVGVTTGLIVLNGVVVGNATSANFTITNSASTDGVIGSKSVPDVNIGTLSITGTITALFADTAISSLYKNETSFGLVFILPCDNTASSKFVSFSMSNIQLTGNTPDDGKKSIIRTFPFTASINNNGGAVFKNDQTIISIQDSDA